VTSLRDLWAGRLPLHDVIWNWAVLRGALLNVGCTLVSMWIWLLQGSGPLAVAALVIHFLPVPYNVAFAVGAWRSAAGLEHTPRTRAVARVFAIALAALFMVI
jgi:hypothetical protein